MKRKVDPADLLGAAEVAELLGVAPKTISSYLARGLMPKPVRRLRSGPVWVRADIEAWVAERPRYGKEVTRP
jgi:predicted DNA-binding transcriptional regulator AlpA